jgi:hypothetical protein
MMIDVKNGSLMINGVGQVNLGMDIASFLSSELGVPAQIYVVLFPKLNLYRFCPQNGSLPN